MLRSVQSGQQKIIESSLAGWEMSSLAYATKQADKTFVRELQLGELEKSTLYQYASTVFFQARRKYTNEITIVSRASNPAISSITDWSRWNAASTNTAHNRMIAVGMPRTFKR
jgi:hypothetical protein